MAPVLRLLSTSNKRAAAGYEARPVLKDLSCKAKAIAIIPQVGYNTYRQALLGLHDAATLLLTARADLLWRALL